MKVWKLISGIISIVLSLIVTFQSCAAGLADALSDEGGTSGSAGLVVAILMTAGGIVSIVTHKSDKNGSNIALIILFGLAALMGFGMHGIFTDLIIWACWCMVIVICSIVSIIINSKKD